MSTTKTKNIGICIASLPNDFCEMNLKKILESIGMGKVESLHFSKPAKCKSAFVWLHLYENDFNKTIYDKLNSDETYCVIYNFPKFFQLTLLEEKSRNSKHHVLSRYNVSLKKIRK